MFGTSTPAVLRGQMETKKMEMEMENELGNGNGNVEIVVKVGVLQLVRKLLQLDCNLQTGQRLNIYMYIATICSLVISFIEFNFRICKHVKIQCKLANSKFLLLKCQSFFIVDVARCYHDTVTDLVYDKRQLSYCGSFSSQIVSCKSKSGWRLNIYVR